MKLRALTVSALLAIAAAAAAGGCSGGSKPAPTGPGPVANDGDPVADPGTPAATGTVVGDATVYATLKASTLALPAGVEEMRCEGEGTLGEQVARWEKDMGGDILVECDQGHCQVSITTPEDAGCDPSSAEGCDGSAAIIQFDLDPAGTIAPQTLQCLLAG